jgi:poly(3-hydroxybutyrate) depolymerase
VASGAPGAAAGAVHLTWRGTAQRARLIVWVAGADAAHTIRVNGHAVAAAPVLPDGEPCQGQPVYLDIPSAVLVQGRNQIELTDDALAGDDWTASQVRLEVFGAIQRPAPEAAGLAAGAAVSLTVNFVNGYDLTSQQAWIQVPSSYNPSVPTPLVLYAHARSSHMYEPADSSQNWDSAVEARGWLLASPQMHGHWPGTAQTPVPNPPGIYAYASLESQYDLVGTLRYMLDNYNVKRDQIYLFGSSMGGQIATVTAAKYPHIFAAVFDSKAPTDMAQWYGESSTFHQDWMERECYTGSAASPQPRTPGQNPFCYQRRSSQSFAGNFLHVPISITHSQADTLVPIAHSFELRDAINALGPDRPAAVYVDTVVGPTCGSPFHCYDPDPAAVMDFFAPFRLQARPDQLRISSDQSKHYYWLNLAQTGGDHWTHVEATAVNYNSQAHVLTLVITDTQALSVGVNLGTAPIAGFEGLSQPGLGWPSGNYLVQGPGLNSVQAYTSGYLTVTVPSEGRVVISLVPNKLYLPGITR